MRRQPSLFRTLVITALLVPFSWVRHPNVSWEVMGLGWLGAVLAIYLIDLAASQLFRCDARRIRLQVDLR